MSYNIVTMDRMARSYVPREASKSGSRYVARQQERVTRPPDTYDNSAVYHLDRGIARAEQRAAAIRRHRELQAEEAKLSVAVYAAQAAAKEKRKKRRGQWNKGVSGNPLGKRPALKGLIRSKLDKLIAQNFDARMAALLRTLAQQHFEGVSDLILDRARAGDELAREILIQGTTTPRMPKPPRKLIEEDGDGYGAG